MRSLSEVSRKTTQPYSGPGPSAEALQNRERLLALLKEHSLLVREGVAFALAAGQGSSYYVDVKMCSLHPEGAYLIGAILFDLLKDTGAEAVGGLTIGADPMVAAFSLVSYLKGHPIPSFIVRETPKKHGTRKHIEGHLPDTPGAVVAVVDDVITTGGSVRKAIKVVEAQGCTVKKIVVLVDRHEGGSDSLRADGYDVTAIFSSTPEGELFIEPAPDP